MDGVMELVEIVVYRTVTLEVSGTFKHINCGGLGVEWDKVLSELIFKVNPVEESESTR